MIQFFASIVYYSTGDRMKHWGKYGIFSSTGHSRVVVGIVDCGGLLPGVLEYKTAIKTGSSD
jgi:hypothetical protein